MDPIVLFAASRMRTTSSPNTAGAPDETTGPRDVPVPVRWTDLDAYGHVNNAAMVRLLEEARIAAFWQPPAEQGALGAPQPPAALPVSGAGAALSNVIASQRREYARPLGHRREEVVMNPWLLWAGPAPR